MNALHRLACAVPLVALALLRATAEAPAETGGGDSFDVSELEPGVWLFQPAGPGPLRTNSLVIDRGGGEIVVLDAQPTPEASRLLLDRIPRFAKGEVRYLVLSHAHAEAAGGASAFPPETIVIASAGYRDAIADPAHDFGAEVRAIVGEGWVEPPRTRPDIVIQAVTELEHESLPVRLMPIQAVHGAGDLLVELPKSNLLYAGGLVFPERNPWASSATVGSWIGVLSRMIESGPSRIVGVRGGVVDGEDLRRERQALAWVVGRVEAAFVERLPLEKIVRRVLDDPGLAQHFDRLASPSFVPRLVEQVVEESAEHRRKRGRPIPGEAPAAVPAESD
jgi:glyoxylase-like metal-dependent hydrolase (beta-lactamase superfamily II)